MTIVCISHHRLHHRTFNWMTAKFAESKKWISKNMFIRESIWHKWKRCLKMAALTVSPIRCQLRLINLHRSRQHHNNNNNNNRYRYRMQDKNTHKNTKAIWNVIFFICNLDELFAFIHRTRLLTILSFYSASAGQSIVYYRPLQSIHSTAKQFTATAERCCEHIERRICFVFG